MPKATDAEIRELADRCLTVMRHLSKSDPSADLSNYISMVERSAEARSRSALRAIWKECVQWSEALGDAENTALDAELRERFGSGLREQAKKQAANAGARREQ